MTTPASVPTAAAVSAAAASSSPTGAPTTAASISLPWPSWIEQGLAAEGPILEALAIGGINLALADVPFGSVVKSFIDPIVTQYLGKALTYLEGIAGKAAPLTVPAASVIGATVNAINTEMPQFAAMIGPELESLVTAAAAKLGIKL